MSNRRKSVKHILSLAVGALLAAYALSGASASAAARGGEVFFFLHAGGEELKRYEEWGKKFAQSNPQFRFKVDFVPFAEYRTKLLTMFAAKNPPDLFWLYFNYAAEFVENDALLSLDNFVARDSFPMGDFAKANVDMFTVSGKLYGLPRESSTLVLYWSKKAFSDAGISPPDDSWDWEGKFLNAAKKLTVASNDPTKRRFGFSAPVGAGMNWAAMPIVWSFGGDVVNESKTRPTANDPATVRGYQWLADLINVHKVAPGLGSLAGQPFAQLFVKGQVGMFVSGKWEVESLRQTTKESGMDSGFDVAVFPRGPAGRMTRTSGGAYAIPKDAKNAEGAWEFIKWFAGKEFTTYYTETGGLYPAYLPVLNSASFLQPGQDPKSARVFVDSLRFARPERVFAKYGELTSLVEAGMDPVYVGSQAARQALDEVQRKAEPLF